MGDQTVAKREAQEALLEQLFPPLPRFEIVSGRTALLVIDMQYLDAHPDYGLGRRARELGIFHLLEGYFERVRIVTANIQRLLAAARANGVEVIHVVIAPNTEDARDCSEVSRMLEIRPPRSSREAAILDELKPQGDEIVLNKITSSAFTSTPLDLILRNLGIDTLILTGVVTNGCVETTARDARDLGYRVILVTDACTALTESAHAQALRHLTRTRGNGRTTDQVVAEIEAGRREPAAPGPLPALAPGQ
jgi:nicotinamidase-related amidase